MYIDPEFAFYGPMGFDVGAFTSNLLLNYFSNWGKGEAGTDYSNWILDQTIIFYETFEKEFIHLWKENEKKGHYGELNILCAGQSNEAVIQQYMKKIFADTLGFAGMKMIRRIIGIAHVADLDSIEDNDKRSLCEKRCLIFARRLVLASQEKTLDGLDTIRKVTEYAKSLYNFSPPENWSI